MLYWLIDKNNEYALEQIKETGVKQNRIFEDRDKLLQTLHKR